MTGLAPKGTARERILVYGASGVGKSTAYISIARRCPESRFFVLDSDFAIDRMLESENLTNVQHRLATDWEGYVEGTRDFQKEMGPNDWLVIDFISTAWDCVQAWYSEQVFGKDIDSYFLERRKAKAKGNAFDGDADWTIINRAYKAWTKILLGNTPGHLFATGMSRAVGERDDAAVKQVYAATGQRVEGQKHLANSMHTVLLLGKTRTGEYHMTTVKDRARKEMEKQTFTDFASAYLVGIAGWRPA